MINLKVNNSEVILPEAPKISIEKKSPVFNKDTGSFSYPFAVPTEKNQKILSFPGRLERANDLPDQSFILDEDGIQILRGTVDYDDVTATETGLVLQSGTTEFTKKMEDKKLSELDFGREAWFTDFTVAAIQAKLDVWNAKNASTDIVDYVVCPFAIKDSAGSTVVVNALDHSTSVAALKIDFTLPTLFNKFYCLQFSVSWLLEKIYKAAGFRVITNQIADSVFKNIVVFGRILRIYSDYTAWQNLETGSGTPEVTVVNVVGFTGDYIYYKDLMPDQKVLDFVEFVKSLLCLIIDIDERLKTVSFILNKNIITPDNIDASFTARELKGFTHKEKKSPNGIKLFYSDQDDEYSAENDFTASGGEVNNETDKPTANADYLDKIIKVRNVKRYYKCEKNDADEYVWTRYARLQPYKTGNGEDETEIKVKIPPQFINGDIDIPRINYSMSTLQDYCDMGQLAISWFRGNYTFSAVSYPILSAEQYSLDGTHNYNSSLTPSDIYQTLFKEWVNSEAYKKREVTKYLLLSLAEVVQLQFRKRYLISGVPILLNQISIELPYREIVKVNGFTT